MTPSGLNTLTFSDPYAKLTFTAFAASTFSRTLYIDLDSTYCAYANAGLLPAEGTDIYLPERGRFIGSLSAAFASLERGGHTLVILDSLSSFYSLYYPAKSIGSLNRLLCVLVMLLVRCGMDLKIPVLVTSMLRYRQDRGWVQSPAARRLVETKSVVRLEAVGSQAEQPIEDKTRSVEIIAHPSLDPGSRFSYPDLIAWR